MKTQQLEVICMFCKKHLGWKEGGNGISHGICQSCLEEQNRLLEEMKNEQQETAKILCR